jgi:hypothetical protein
MKYLLLILFIGLFVSCKNIVASDSSRDSLKVKETELLKRELALKERELTLMQAQLDNQDSKKEIPISDQMLDLTEFSYPLLAGLLLLIILDTFLLL